MSYHQQGGPEGRRQGPPYPMMGANGGAGGRAPAAGVYGMPQYGQEGYGGPPPSPVVGGGWDRGYVSGLEDTYMRQDPGLPLGTGTPIASGASGSSETGYLVSGGNTNGMAAPLQSYYPPSLYGVPTSVYPFQQPAGFPGPYGGSGAGGAGAAGNAGAGAGSTGGANFYGQSGYARSTNPGQPIQTTNNLQGPDGCNLFVFHIPNTMTNEALFRLFSKFGNVISARIMVEKATGRSRGFGFVSYDNRDSAEKAIAQMNGYQIEHKRLKVQHKKDKERDRYNVTAPSPTQRMMPGGPTATAGGVTGRVQQPQHFRQTLLPQHTTALRHHTVGEDKPPPPSPAAEAGAGGVSQGFAVSAAEEELPEHGEGSTAEVGIDGSVDPTFGSGAPRPSGGEKYARSNDHPHLAYIYRGRGTTRDDETVPGGYPSAGGADSKANVGEDESPEQAADGSAYRGRDDGSYLAHGGAPSSAGVGGNRPRPASPDPKTGVPRPRSASPSAAAASAAAAVAAAAAVSLPHQTLEHAMQTKLTLGAASP